MEIVIPIARHIKSLRETSGLSQKEVATRLNIDEKNYGNLERGGKKRIDLALVQAISVTLGIDLAILLQPLAQTLKSKPVANKPHDKVCEDASQLECQYVLTTRQLLSIIKSQQLIIRALTWSLGECPRATGLYNDVYKI